MKKFLYISFIIAAFISLCSCADDDKGAPTPPGEKAQIYLRLRAPGGFDTHTSSRALTFEQENTIADVHVLVFNSTDALVDIEQGEVVSSTPGSDTPGVSGEASFAITLPTSRNSADTYNLVVLANAEEILTNAIGNDATSPYIGRTRADVMAAVHGSIAGKMYNNNDATNNTIPLWGESGPLIVVPGANAGTLQLTRAIARIDVGVGEATRTGNSWSWNGLDANDQPIAFRLGHVYVMRPNNQYAVMPVVPRTGTPTIPAGATAFTAAQSETLFAYDATPSNAGGYVTQQIYVPETDILMGTNGSAGDLNHTNRMAIVVGGYYDGSATETYYRLDFAVSRMLINVLRNHLYQFSIAGVTGTGFPTVQAAYESEAMNMTVNIYDWNVTDMSEIFLDGSSYIMLRDSEGNPESERRVTLLRPAGAQSAIELRTNISLQHFQLSLDNGGALVNPADPTVIQNDRFKVELKVIDGLTYFVFTALQAYNAEATDDPSVLTVIAGRISFTITIRQIDSDPGDWGDGGNFEQAF